MTKSRNATNASNARKNGTNVRYVYRAPKIMSTMKMMIMIDKPW